MSLLRPGVIKQHKPNQTKPFKPGRTVLLKICQSGPGGVKVLQGLLTLKVLVMTINALGHF